MKSHVIIVCVLLLSTSVSWAAIIWSDPVLLSELNDPVTGAAFYPNLSRDGSTLYFGRYVGEDRQLFTAAREY